MRHKAVPLHKNIMRRGPPRRSSCDVRLVSGRCLEWWPCGVFYGMKSKAYGFRVQSRKRSVCSHRAMASAFNRRFSLNVLMIPVVATAWLSSALTVVAVKKRCVTLRISV